MRNQPFRVAVVAPPFGPTGGPEIVVKNLTDALLEKGIDVTLFAPADWKTKSKHIATLPQSLWNMEDFTEQTEIERNNFRIISQLKIVSCQQNFNIIHLHSQAYASTVASLLTKPCILTIHNKIAPRDFNQIHDAGIFTVMLSKNHKNNLHASAVVANGIATKKISFSLKKKGYLMTVGRIAEPKGIDIAIKIAQKANKKLLIFGRIGNSPERQAYFNEKIKPHLNKQIVYVGEVSQDKLFNYMKNASALLFPIIPRKNKYLSVIPLVVMESLACGTPIIGTNIQPFPKQLRDKKIACLSSNIGILSKAAASTEKFNPSRCRKLAEKYFDSSVMAEKYIKLYKKYLRRSQSISIAC